LKQQLLLLAGGIAILSCLLFFGTTVAKKEVLAPSQSKASAPAFDINQYLADAKKGLPVNQLNYVDAIENSVKRGDVKEQQIISYTNLANFWKDTAKNADLYLFYTSEASKLANSEKNLTFAAQQILDNLRNENDVAKRGWKALQAVELFEKAIELNPNNDDLKIGLGSCYIFGKGMAGDAQETMKGVQQLLQVVRKDSSNMKAQMVLGIGGVISTQYDKAVNRLLIVLKNDPNNVEAMSWLADAYAGKGDKENALKWYDVTKRIVNNPKYSKEVDERIKSLKEKMPD